MSIGPPELETRTFEEVVAEARRRIGRYTPEYALGWTDHNESDPGIVLVQLLAWLAQITGERVNRLPERAYRSLLELLGFRMRPARPAEADLVFEPVPGVASRIVVPEGTRVGAPPAPDGSPVVFETSRPLDVISAELAHVLTYDGTTFRSLTALNEPDAETFRPFGERPETGAALYFGFARPSSAERGWRPFPARIALRAFEPEVRGEPQPVSCGEAPSRARAEMRWEYLPGPGRSWEPLDVFEDETRALEVGGYLALAGPSAIEPAALWTVDEPHYWLRLQVRNPEYGSAVPEVAFFRFNAVRARHELTVADELLGTSDGSPDQTMTLRWAPVVPGSLDLEVQDEGGRFRTWTEVELFRGADPEETAAAPAAGGEGGGTAEDGPLAGPEARVYRLEPETGTVTFGDAYRAAIPPAGSEIVARRYRYGGGTAGNVDAEQITTLQTTLPGVSEVTNPRSATGGLAAQSVTEALRAAPQWLRRRERAVTARDFEDGARDVGGVARAAALPNVHPDYPGVKVPGSVTILVVQETERTPPRPTETLLRQVCSELDAQRTLATEVHVRSPRFRKVDVEARLLVDPTLSLSRAEEAGRARLQRFLSPLPAAEANGSENGGRPPAEVAGGWRFGQDLYPANLLSQLLSLPDDVGIRAVEGLRIHVDGRLHRSRTEPVALDADELVYPGRIDLTPEPYREE